MFPINHRAAPRFHYPAAIDDVQRAIRFVRHHAPEFGIDGRRLGGFGGSSGGHLVGLAAMLAAPGLAGDADPVNREPATLQAVVLRAAPTDLTRMRGGFASMPRAIFMNGVPPGRELPPGIPASAEPYLNEYTAASPLAQVSPSSSPALLLHGDADTEVPFEQAEAMEAALRAVNVPTKLSAAIGRRSWRHLSDRWTTERKTASDLPNVIDEMVRWLNQYLKGN